MNDLYRIVLLSSILIVSGCVFTTGPSNNLAFNDSINLESLEGVYQNIGEADQSLAPSNRPDFHIYLSAIIWPGNKNLDHVNITAVEVRKTGEKALTVKALENGKVRLESVFEEGSDFTLKAGRIRLKTEVFLADPILGPGYQTVEFGIDTGGDGKYRTKSGMAGLAFLVMPVAAVETNDVRFVRIAK